MRPTGALPAFYSLLLLLTLAFAGAAAAVAAEDEAFRPYKAEEIPIVSKFAPLAGDPQAMATRNDMGGNSINVVFNYVGGSFAQVSYNESPQKLAKPEISVAAEVALKGHPFKDGSFELGQSGMAASPLGDFDFQVVHAQQPIGTGPLLSCAVFQRLISAGMAAITGYFCDRSDAFSLAELGVFFGKLGIRGIGVPD